MDVHDFKENQIYSVNKEYIDLLDPSYHSQITPFFKL
jgi:hypothetical protein